jgi:hypothetical protein
MLARIIPVFALVFGGTRALAQVSTVITDTTAVGAPTIETLCSRTRARVGVARISWSLRRDSLVSPALDFTVFKDGFERGLFGSVAADGRDTTIVLTPALRRDDARPRPFAVDAVRGRSRGPAGVLQIESLEPGVNYFWRLRADGGGRWVAGETVRSQAPTCPSDAADER